MGVLATILSWAVTIVALMLLFKLAFDATLAGIELIINRPFSGMESMVVVFILFFVFFAIGGRVGRMVRDWINAGKRVVRQPAR